MRSFVYTVTILLFFSQSICGVDFHMIPIYSKINKNKNILLEKGKYSESIIYNLKSIKNNLSKLNQKREKKEETLELLLQKKEISIKEALQLKKEINVMKEKFETEKTLYIDQNFFIITQKDKKNLSFLNKNKPIRKPIQNNYLEYFDQSEGFKNMLFFTEDTIFRDSKERTIIKTL